MLVARAMIDPIVYRVTRPAFAEPRRPLMRSENTERSYRFGDAGRRRRYGDFMVRIQTVADEIVLDDDLVIAGDNALVLDKLPDAAFDLVYLDPPFNTGRAQSRRTLSVAADRAATASASGVGATARGCCRRSATTTQFGDYLGFLAPRLERSRELLAPHGTLYFHIDYREAHYCKLLLDEIVRSRRVPERDDLDLRLRRQAARGAGPPSTTRSSSTCGPPARITSTPTRSSASRTWRRSSSTAEKAARGKRPTDVWFHTIVPTNGAREDGLPDSEARGRAAADRGGVLAPGRLVPGPVRRLGHARRRLPARSAGGSS